MKPFAHSADGIRAVVLNTGDERDHFDGNETGLLSEGFIKAIRGEPKKAPEPAEANDAAPADEVAADFAAPEVTAQRAPVRRGRKQGK